MSRQTVSWVDAIFCCRCRLTRRQTVSDSSSWLNYMEHLDDALFINPGNQRTVTQSSDGGAAIRCTCSPDWMFRELSFANTFLLGSHHFTTFWSCGLTGEDGCCCRSVSALLH